MKRQNDGKDTLFATNFLLQLLLQPMMRIFEWLASYFQDFSCRCKTRATGVITHHFCRHQSKTHANDLCANHQLLEQELLGICPQKLEIMVAKKRKSKRQTLQKKYKIQKRVKEHKKRLKKGSLTVSTKANKDTDNRIPNAWPYKAELLNEIQAAKAKMEENKLRQKEKRHEEIVRHSISYQPSLIYPHSSLLPCPHLPLCTCPSTTTITR